MRGRWKRGARITCSNFGTAVVVAETCVGRLTGRYEGYEYSHRKEV